MCHNIGYFFDRLNLDKFITKPSIIRKYIEVFLL